MLRKKSCLQLFFLGLVAFFLASGCSASQDLTLELGPQARISFSLTLEPFFGNYLKDLGSQSQNDQELFDVLAIRGALEELGLQVVSIQTLNNRTINLELLVPDPQSIAKNQLKTPEFLTWSATSRPSRLDITINQEIVRKLISTTSLVQEDGLRYLLPSPGSSARDYLDDLVWMLEEYEEPVLLERILRDSELRLIIKTPRDILRLDGPGTTRKSPREAEIRLGMLDVLTLGGSRLYTLEY